MNWILLIIGVIGLITWLYDRINSGGAPSEFLPPPRKYKLPKRPKNDDPGRWYG